VTSFWSTKKAGQDRMGRWGGGGLYSLSDSSVIIQSTKHPAENSIFIQTLRRKHNKPEENVHFTVL